MDVVIFDVEGLVDQEPLLQVDLLVDLSVEPLLRYHAKVHDHVELAVSAVDQLHLPKILEVVADIRSSFWINGGRLQCLRSRSGLRDLSHALDARPAC